MDEGCKFLLPANRKWASDATWLDQHPLGRHLLDHYSSSHWRHWHNHSALNSPGTHSARYPPGLPTNVLSGSSSFSDWRRPLHSLALSWRWHPTSSHRQLNWPAPESLSFGSSLAGSCAPGFAPFAEMAPRENFLWGLASLSVRLRISLPLFLWSSCPRSCLCSACARWACFSVICCHRAALFEVVPRAETLYAQLLVES